MALNGYLRLKGSQQGDILGSVTQKGRGNMIQVDAFEQNSFSPRDPQSGLATGRRQYQPLSITKPVDRSTVPLRNAFIHNETMLTWELQFWTPQLKAGTGTGSEMQFYTIRLTNAQIASIHQVMLDVKDPTLMRFDLREQVTFTFQKIEWVWVADQLVAEDDWEPQQS